MPDWTIVTTTYNSAHSISQYWGQVSFGSEFEWIVVDNASQDDSAKVAAFLGAKVIRLDKNVGFSKANNIGFNAASSEHIAFVNPDVTPILSDLERLTSYLDTQECIIAPQLTNPDGTLQPNGRGAPYLAHKILHRVFPEKDTGYRHFAGPGQIEQVSWLMGAVVLSTKTVFKRVGPWDERYFLYYEDSELGAVSQKEGIPVLVVGDVQWVHGWARETSRLSWKPWMYEIRSAWTFYTRHPRLLSPSAFLNPVSQRH